ncbi:MAG TPA: hypothetical protein VF630_16030, partial [Hymenobacter sp.]
PEVEVPAVVPDVEPVVVVPEVVPAVVPDVVPLVVPEVDPELLPGVFWSSSSSQALSITSDEHNIVPASSEIHLCFIGMVIVGEKCGKELGVPFISLRSTGPCIYA